MTLTKTHKSVKGQTVRLDKFVTPIKCALSASQEKGDAFSYPSEQARKNAHKDFSEDSRLEVLQITSVLSVAKLKELVEAVRERCVDSGKDGEKVLKNMEFMEFMTNAHKVNNKKTLLAMLSRFWTWRSSRSTNLILLG